MNIIINLNKELITLKFVQSVKTKQKRKKKQQQQKIIENTKKKHTHTFSDASESIVLTSGRVIQMEKNIYIKDFGSSLD